MPSYEQYRDDYAARWAAMSMRPEWKARAAAQAKRISDARHRYEPVSAETGVPWFVIGIIHLMECGGSFRGHLHNGDPLTGRTFQVPKGRPVASPSTPAGYTWEESALDALRYDGLDKVTDWAPERLAWCLEKFNGFGYRGKGVPSAYLWSGTNQYASGKYIRDGVWDSAHVSQQVGGMAILRVMLDSGDVQFAPELAPAAAEFPKAEKAAEPDAPAISLPSPGTFTKINELADQGSRVAGWIRSIKRWWWGSTTVATAGSAALMNTNGGTKHVVSDLIAAHPYLFVALVAGVLAVVIYVGVKIVERYLITAWRDGRYRPRGA